jgi:hypothetical protein
MGDPKWAQVKITKRQGDLANRIAIWNLALGVTALLISIAGIFLPRN